MRFVVDAQLPPALARLLTSHGHTAEHVSDIGLSHTSIAPVIVWLRIGNTSRRALLHWVEPLIPQIVQLIDQGDRFVEVR